MAGIFDSIEGALSNPLLQTALAGYLGAIGSPRYKGIGGAISQGGLSGLEQFSQAEQLKTQLPLQQAQTQLAQQQVPLAQQQVELGKKRLQPLTPDIKSRLDAYQTSATDPEEKNFIGLIEAQAQQGLIGPEDVDKALESFDENKRLMELYKGQAAQYQASVTPYMLQTMFPGMQLPPAPGSAGPSPAPSGAPSGGLPPTAVTGGTGAMPNFSSLAPGTKMKMNIPGKGDVDIAKDNDGKVYYLEGGTTWKPVS